MNATQKSELVRDILDVVRDGSRIDRFLACGLDGWHMTTRDDSETQYEVKPWLDGGTEEEEEEFANQLVAACEHAEDASEIAEIL